MSENFEEMLSRIQLSVRILTNINSFVEEIKSDLELSMNFNQYSPAHRKCYLIQKEWIKEYKRFYLYDKLLNYINDGNITRIDLFGVKALSNYMFNKHKTEYINNYNKNNKKFIQYSDENNKNIFIPKLSKKFDDSNVSYPNNFEIINEETYKLIIEEHTNKVEKSDLIIVNKRIIIKYNNSKNIILIINLETIGNDCDYLFNLEILLDFHNNKNACDMEFERLKKDNNIILIGINNEATYNRSDENFNIYYLIDRTDDSNDPTIPNFINDYPSGPMTIKNNINHNANIPNIPNNINNNNNNLINTNINNNNQNNILRMSVTNEINSEPLIGLMLENNALPFINPIIECLCHIKSIINFFKYDNSLQVIASNNFNTLSFSLKYLIENIYQTNQRYIDNQNFGISTNIYFIPREFNNKLNILYNHMNNNQEPLVKNYIKFILKKLHEELNIAPLRNNLDKFNFNQNNINIEIIRQNFCTFFLQRNDSTIIKLFHFLKGYHIQCINCNRVIKYGYYMPNNILFPLEQISILKSLNEQNYNIKNKIDLLDCFKYYLGRQNTNEKTLCQFCGQTFLNSSYQEIMVSSPIIFIIIFERNTNCNIIVDFKEELDLSNYVESKGSTKYKLIGVITRVKKNNSSCYQAYCKSFIDNDWYCYQNDFIHLVVNFKQEVINDINSNVEILFYKNLK